MSKQNCSDQTAASLASPGGLPGPREEPSRSAKLHEAAASLASSDPWEEPPGPAEPRETAASLTSPGPREEPPGPAEPREARPRPAAPAEGLRAGDMRDMDAL